jgi:hypothetical protein
MNGRNIIASVTRIGLLAVASLIARGALQAQESYQPWGAPAGSARGGCSNGSCNIPAKSRAGTCANGRCTTGGWFPTMGTIIPSPTYERRLALPAQFAPEVTPALTAPNRESPYYSRTDIKPLAARATQPASTSTPAKNLESPFYE